MYYVSLGFFFPPNLVKLPKDMLCNQIVQRNIGKLVQGFCLFRFLKITVDGYTCNSSEFSYSKVQISVFCKGK